MTLTESNTRDRDWLLFTHDLRVVFQTRRGSTPVPAVDGVSLNLAAGETVALVGESGSGKTTFGRAILGLVPVDSGQILFEGLDISNVSGRHRRQLATKLQAVFQDPYSSLNPARSVGQTLRESAEARTECEDGWDSDAAVRKILELVGLPANAANRYPRQFSGGQRQRIAIARALVAGPRLVICDEAVSALDLSVQAQVLNLLGDLQAELGVSYLFISHDLSVVRHVSDRVAVLYRGCLLEEGAAEEVCATPSHPYTQALLAASLVPDPAIQRQRSASRTSLPASSAGTSERGGCVFSHRCPYVIDRCLVERPSLVGVESGKRVACHRWKELAARSPYGN